MIELSTIAIWIACLSLGIGFINLFLVCEARQQSSVTLPTSIIAILPQEL